jgi:hypothetical protein
MQKSLLYSSKLLVVVNKTVTPIEAEYRAACPGAMPSTILRRKKITSSKSSRHAPVQRSLSQGTIERIGRPSEPLAVKQALNVAGQCVGRHYEKGIDRIYIVSGDRAA